MGILLIPQEIIRCSGDEYSILEDLVLDEVEEIEDKAFVGSGMEDKLTPTFEVDPPQAVSKVDKPIAHTMLFIFIFLFHPIRISASNAMRQLPKAIITRSTPDGSRSKFRWKTDWGN